MAAEKQRLVRKRSKGNKLLPISCGRGPSYGCPILLAADLCADFVEGY